MRLKPLAAASLLLAVPVLAREPQRVAPAGAPSSGAVAGPGEPGDRLAVIRAPWPAAATS